MPVLHAEPLDRQDPAAGVGHGKVAGVGELDPRARLMRAFNDHVLADPRTQSVIVPIADGLTLVTVNG